MKYKAIGFDYGGVISGEPNPDFFPKISLILEIDPILCKRIYLENNYLFHVDGLSFEDLWKRLLVKFNRIEKEKEVLDFLRIQHNNDVNNDLIDLIKILRENYILIEEFTSNPNYEDIACLKID